MFDYGKYTPYVLSSYAIALVVLVGVSAWSILRVINARRKLDLLEGAERGRDADENKKKE